MHHADTVVDVYDNNRDAIIDLVLLALSQQCYAFELEPNAYNMKYSGFSMLALNLQTAKPILSQLIGRPDADRPLPVPEPGMPFGEAAVVVAPPAVDGHAVFPHPEVEPAPAHPVCGHAVGQRHLGVGVLGQDDGVQPVEERPLRRGQRRNVGRHPFVHVQPSSRRAVVRNPVCPTMRWSGRTERASTCQVRRITSWVSARPNGASSSSSAWRSSAVWLMVGR